MTDKVKTIKVTAKTVENMDTITAPTAIMEPETISTPVVKNKITSLDQSGKLDLSKYTKEELAVYKEKANSLDVKDNTSILNYGVQVQGQLTTSSAQLLNNVRSFDAGSIGGDINDLLTEINYIDIDPTQKSGLQRFIGSIPILKKLVMGTKKMFEKYDTVSANVDKIVTKLDLGRITIIKDNNMLDTLFTNNVEFVEDLEGLIIGGSIKMEELQNELREMEINSDQHEDYEISDKRDFIDRLGKRLHDMALTRIITLQTLPQIRMIQSNNNTMIEKVQSSINTTIPVWQNQLALAVVIQRQNGIADVQNKVYETTNKILQKNAEMLKTTTLDIAKQNERGVVDIETLKKVQTELISTINDLKKIKEEGDAQRKLATKELENLEKGIHDSQLQLK